MNGNIKGLGQCMSAVEYRAILKYRLMIPLFRADDPCHYIAKNYRALSIDMI
ncbi:hypothetical protein Hanom_Chr13g01197091 [Helianthus anomalus]